MKIQRIDPMGGGQVHALGMKYVERDEVVDVPEDVAAMLLIQTENWRLPDKAPKKDEDFLSKLLADHHRSLLIGSGFSPEPQPAADPTGEGDQA